MAHSLTPNKHIIPSKVILYYLFWKKWHLFIYLISIVVPREVALMILRYSTTMIKSSQSVDNLALFSTGLVQTAGTTLLMTIHLIPL